ncbi:MAG: thiamine phosphate synthase [Anaerovoracaceae bacterium]
MSDILCVTSRRLCSGDFLTQLEKIAEARPAGIILREKDLPEEEYMDLAGKVMKLCTRAGVPCILHSFPAAARQLHAEAIHLPLDQFLTMDEGDKASFRVIGVSCHSLEDAETAEKHGATYISAGHIFDTDCKKGMPGRGLAFLEEVCKAVAIPVYAIGGISPENIETVRNAGAAGACIMSGLMRCEDPKDYLNLLQEKTTA